ncbi:MAG TPA: NUDIX pyrophosphatase [Candidatus Saccharimonadales bacterium]|nr:NUDIX pyrophosphatase [Candidatus Saccharimonadales bacterium]
MDQTSSGEASPVFVALATVYRRKDNRFEFLVIKRVPDDGGFWQPITGGIDAGETPRETVIREIAEEVGISELLHVSEELARHEFELDDGRRASDILHAVEVPVHAEVVLSHEHEDHHWLPLEDAIALLKFDTNKAAMRLALQYAQANLPPEA